MKSSLLEVEVDSSKNHDLFFGPLNRRIRGGYDVKRAAQHDKDAVSLMTLWPEPIPGQRLALNAETKQAHLIEPLHEDRYTAIREKIVDRKVARLEPHETTYANVDVATWLHHIKCAVEAGVAKVISGELPEVIEGNPRKWFRGEERKGESACLAEAIEKQTAAAERQAESFERLEKLLEGLLKKR